jgi:hypothetical protein
MRSNSIRKFLLATLLMAVPASSFAGVIVSITVAPPALPVYTQPICPGDGYIWTPGYWAYGPEGYYWVPGTWVVAPRAGFLWTPGYWGFAGGIYGWHGGYWGSHIGFYGGVNYGFGYGGVGFAGGRWEGGHFAYNSAVSNVNTTVIHNTYVDKTVINNTTVNRTSFNGPNGVRAEPTAQERSAMNEPHVAPTGVQTSHEHAASLDRSQLASANHGRPANVAMARPMGAANRSAETSRPAPASTNAPHPNAAPAHQNAPHSQAKPASKPAPHANHEHPEEHH